MSEIQSLLNQINSFREERDWKQFHNLKDLTVALNVESSELLELFLWKGAEEADQERIREELADVLIYALLIAEESELNVKEIVEQKLKANAKKYPVDKAKGNAKKYSELDP